jgi:hypothetical protein
MENDGYVRPYQPQMGAASTPSYDMSTDPTPEDIAPLGSVLQALIEGSGIELGLMDTLKVGLAEMIGQYGVAMADVRIVRTLLNGDEDGDVLPGIEPKYRYDAAFPDPHPGRNQELITLPDFLNRNWDAPSHTRYADTPAVRLDQFDRPTGSTLVTHDAEAAFNGSDAKPKSESARRALAKKQEEEREALAAEARARRGVS